MLNVGGSQQLNMLLRYLSHYFIVIRLEIFAVVFMKFKEYIHNYLDCQNFDNNYSLLHNHYM